jgi:hypothetical protein
VRNEELSSPAIKALGVMERLVQKHEFPFWLSELAPLYTNTPRRTDKCSRRRFFRAPKAFSSLQQEQAVDQVYRVSPVRCVRSVTRRPRCWDFDPVCPTGYLDRRLQVARTVARWASTVAKFSPACRRPVKNSAMRRPARMATRT